MSLQEPTTYSLPFDNSYARLPERFFSRQAPSPVAQPGLIKLNEELARSSVSTRIICRHVTVSRSWPATVCPRAPSRSPWPMPGNQFGNWVPQLGDGRAILLGEVVGRDGVRRDIQLKGAGQTPFSRMGDGRAWLGPVLREYVVSEAMAALGIPTTRALAAVFTGEEVLRETALPGAVLTRVARAHIRVGTFQFFAARGDDEAVRLLADYVIDRLYPELKTADEPYRALLEAVVARQAALVAGWQHVGFIHGVMNTDNMSIAGETIDYGPCAFMDSYHPQTVYSSIDQMGRYAFANQPAIAQWNLAVLAQSMLPLFGKDEATAIGVAQEAVDAFLAHYNTAWLDGMRAKLGMGEARDGDKALVQGLLDRMATGNCDYTLLFRTLSQVSLAEAKNAGETSRPFHQPAVD